MSRRVRILIFLVFAAIFVFHAAKGLGYPPLIFPDEYTYVTATLREPIEESEIPNFLYYSIYRVTGLFGDRFLDAARILNAAAFAAATPFIYAIARIGCGAALSAFIALMSLLLPFSWYTVVFQPESLFYTLFWCLAWLLIVRCDLRPAQTGLAAGALTGAAALVKVHALFFLPCLILFFLATPPRNGYVKSRLSAIASTLAAFFAVKFSVGYALAGKSAFTLLGTVYGNFAESGFASFPTAFEYCALFLTNFWGHILTGAFLFGLPVALAIPAAFSRADGGEDDFSPIRRFSRLFFAFLLPMAAMAGAYAITMHSTQSKADPPEIMIVVSRYYDFLAPACLILPGYVISLSREKRGHLLRRGGWLCLCAAAFGLYSLATQGRGYIFYLPNSPVFTYFFALTGWHTHAAWMALALSILSCLLAACRWDRACEVFLFLFVPVFCIVFQVTAFTWFSAHHNPSSPFKLYDNAGLFLRDFLGEERSELTMYDGSPSFGARILYSLNAPGVRWIHKIWNEKADPALLKPGGKWVVTVGRVSPPPGIVRRSFAIIRPPITPVILSRIADYTYSVDRADPAPGWPVKAVESDPVATVVFYRLPLPVQVRVRLGFSDPRDAPDVEFEVGIQGMEQPLAVSARELAERGVVLRNENNGTVLYVGLRDPSLAGTAPAPAMILVEPVAPDSRGEGKPLENP